MASTDRDLLLDVLHAAYDAAPEALYPARFAQERGIDRVALDHALDQLRLSGLLRLTEWVQGLGQGYTLTPAGMEVLDNPRSLRPGMPPPAVRVRVPEPYEDEDRQRREPVIRPVRPVVSWALIVVNVLIFFATESHAPGADDLGGWLVARGVLLPNAVLLGHDWWRLLSYAFLHSGPFHVFMNMYALYLLGPLMEAMWGSARMLLLYLVSAVTGGCVVVWVHRVDDAGREIATVGASGAICGLLTSIGIWVLLNRDHLPPALTSSISRSVVINLVLIGGMSFLPGLNVSWEGHLGGAIGGAIASFPLQWSRYGGTRWQRVLGCVGTLAVAAAFVLFALSRGLRA